MIMRIFGLFTAVAYLVFGSIAVVMLFIIGAWEAFARPLYFFGFLLAVIYVYGTVWMGWSLWRQPRPRRALYLGLLLLPLLLEMGRFYLTYEPEHIDQIVATYAHSADPEAVAAAREQLLEKGLLAGHPPHVRELLAHLEQAEDDASRIHLIEMLGDLSRQNEAVLDALDALKAQSRNDPNRQALYEAASEAAGKVNPYGSAGQLQE